MVLAMLQCSMVGKWTGGAVGAGNGKRGLNPEVSGASVFSLPVCCPKSALREWTLWYGGF